MPEGDLCGWPERAQGGIPTVIAGRRHTHVRMWEARCVDGRTDDAVAWVQRVAAPDALEAGAHTAEVFRSEDRVVLLTRWPTETRWVEPTPDPDLVARCHAWPFESVGDR